MFKTVAKLFALLIVALSMIATTHAQTFPERSVKIVVPYPPGAFNDSLARMSSEKLTKLWNQTVVVENKPGGNTTIGNNYVAKSAGDGYTILVTPLPFSALPALYGSKLPYDALNDFQALILAGVANNVLATRKGLGIKDVNALIAYAKQNPSKLNYGSTGSGSSNHLSMELLMSMTGIKLTHVPYKGTAPAMADLLGGQLQVMFSDTAIPHINAGKLIALAISGTTRSKQAPNIPTFSELGVKGFDTYTWFGVMVPKGTEPAIIHRLNKELTVVTKDPALQAWAESQNGDMMTSTPAEFAAAIKADLAKWKKVIDQTGVVAE